MSHLQILIDQINLVILENLTTVATYCCNILSNLLNGNIEGPYSPTTKKPLKLNL